MTRPGDQEMLFEVERLIEDFRWARNQTDAIEHRTYLVLKALADDIRGRQPLTVGSTAHRLQERIDNAAQSKSALGYGTGHLIGIGQEVIGCWSTLRQALEKFEQGRKGAAP